MTNATVALGGKSDPIVTDNQVDCVIRQTQSNPAMGCARMAGAIAEGFSDDVEELFYQLGSNEGQDWVCKVEFRCGLAGAGHRDDELPQGLSEVRLGRSALCQQGDEPPNIEHQIIQLVNGLSHMDF